MSRPRGLSVRVKLTLSYAGFLMVAGALLLVATWWSLLRGYPASVLAPNFSSFLQDLDPRNFGPRAFGSAAFAVLLFLLSFGLIGGWVLAGRMLAPLDRITSATRMAGGGSLSHRIRLPGRRDEFRELADAFDGMLERLEAHVAEQQRFAANASHELRTPLAITQTLLEVANKDGKHGDGELLSRLSDVNRRAIDLTEALLLLYRADQRSFVPERIDLSLIAEEATEMLLPFAERQGVTVETAGTFTPTLGSPTLVLQMTTNLLHNAIVHNQRTRGAVWINTELVSDTAVLTIENTGEHLAAGLVQTLTEPFQRGTERTHTDHSGVGLGLAIVERIASAHAGELSLSPRSAGGLVATVRLPAAPTPRN